MSHTSGKWRVLRWCELGSIPVGTSQSEIVASVHLQVNKSTNKRLSTEEGNAILIAAAPEMLDALRRIVQYRRSVIEGVCDASTEEEVLLACELTIRNATEKSPEQIREGKRERDFMNQNVSFE